MLNEEVPSFEVSVKHWSREQDPPEVKIFLALLRKHPLTMTEISKSTKLSAGVLHYHLPIMLSDGVLLKHLIKKKKTYELQPLFYNDGAVLIVFGMLEDLLIHMAKHMYPSESASASTSLKENLIHYMSTIKITYEIMESGNGPDLSKYRYSDRNGRTVYFIQVDGPDKFIKIGVTNNLERRFANINISTPYPVKLLGSMKGDFDLERLLHSRFHKYLVRGEWFYPDEEILQYIEENCT